MIRTKMLIQSVPSQKSSAPFCSARHYCKRYSPLMCLRRYRSGSKRRRRQKIADGDVQSIAQIQGPVEWERRALRRSAHHVSNNAVQEHKRCRKVQNIHSHPGIRTEPNRIYQSFIQALLSPRETSHLLSPESLREALLEAAEDSRAGDLVVGDAAVDGDEDARVVLLVQTGALAAVGALVARVSLTATRDLEVDALRVVLRAVLVTGGVQGDDLVTEDLVHQPSAGTSSCHTKVCVLL